MSWTYALKIGTADFDVLRDPNGRFGSKRAACDEVITLLERQRADIAKAMRKARQMHRRARA